MTALNYPRAGPQETLSYDAMGNLNTIGGNICSEEDNYGNCTSWGAMQWVWSTSYSNTGQLNGFQTFFGAYSAYYGYSYNTLQQLNQVAYGTNIVNTSVNLTYTYPTGSNNGRIAQFSDSSTGEVVNYTYDALNRLIAATTSNSTGPQWGESYAYDGFGNLLSKTATQGSAPQASLVVNSATNQLGNAGSVDANGNALWGTGTGVTQFAWDGENRLVAPAAQDSSGNWVTYSYDPWGKRVLQYATAGSASTVSTCVLYFYGANGKRLGTYNCGYSNGQFSVSTANVNVYFGKKLIASGSEMNQNAVFTDRLGSVRGQAFGAPIAYFPYGEERTSTPNGTEKFGTYFRDGYGQDYADQRYYTAVAGRFWSPDPLGHKAAKSSNPETWNRYAYVEGDPANSRDCRGLDDGDGRCWDDEAVPTRPRNPIRALDDDCDDDPGSGGEPPPPPPPQPEPLTCDFTASGFDSVNAEPQKNDKGQLAWGATSMFQFTASGGSGYYTFLESQYFQVAISLTLNNGRTVSFTNSGNDEPLDSTQNGGVIAFEDAPQLIQTGPNGTRLTSGSYTGTFNLYVTVTDGTQVVECPEVDWYANINVTNGVGSGIGGLGLIAH
jgi:RHS repeat-associated protein